MNDLDILIKAPSGNYVAIKVTINEDELIIQLPHEIECAGYREAIEVLENFQQKVLYRNKIPHGCRLVDHEYIDQITFNFKEWKHYMRGE